MQVIKPQKLNKGDTIGIVSCSAGLPSIFPHIYEKGLENLEKLGFKIKEYPSARKDFQFLYENPKFRADDLNEAFADPETKAIFTSIGGNDSIRILPFLDIEKIKSNPKIFMGYSDSTTINTYLSQNGIVTFYGPAIMAGFSQYENLGIKFQQYVNSFLFGEDSSLNYFTYDQYSEGYPDWTNPDNVGQTKPSKPNSGWNWLQGEHVSKGKLWGGCIEVLEFLKGTDFWPSKDFFDNKILFFETSEEKPTPNQVKYILRNYGMQGIFEKISALIFGRPRDYTDSEKIELEKIILQVVNGEFRKKDLTIVTNMDFGHTDPQFILPYNIEAELNPTNKTFKLLESPMI